MQATDLCQHQELEHQDIAILVKNITKVYKLYQKPIDRFKEVIHPFNKKYHQQFYALNNVSFTLKKGECVGILGRNGAGKSTLLKIITGVLTPSSGYIERQGKISSLLELGAGFNPEYTGLENIYFQSSLLGYKKKEIETRLPNILEFADIGKFIYQKVKGYSSGMFARLAFAVAINIEPDILIVDEALSVGDVRFQNKCISKMMSIIEKGVTVLFVSHDLNIINKFCKRAIWLKNGQIYIDGLTRTVTDIYNSHSHLELDDSTINQSSNSDLSLPNWHHQDPRLQKLTNVNGLGGFGQKDAEIIALGLFSKSNNPISTMQQGETIKFLVLIKANKDIPQLKVVVTLVDRLNSAVIIINTAHYQSVLAGIKAGDNYLATIEFVAPRIYPTEYNINIALSDHKDQQQHVLNSVLTATVLSKDDIDGGLISLDQHEVDCCYEQIFI